MDEEIEKKLETKGWHLQPMALRRILDQVKQAVADGFVEGGEFEAAVIGQLLDTDLKFVGLRCLPDLQSLRQMRKLQGLWVLQVVSVVDVCESTANRGLVNDGHHSRLLRLRLSDGHSTVTAIEYRSVPFLSEDIAPGTKVILGSTVPSRSAILCLEKSNIQILGGHVSCLYDAWEYDRKYSGIARDSASNPSRSLPEGGTGPPPFRSLQLSGTTQRTTQRAGIKSQTSGSSTIALGHVTPTKAAGKSAPPNSNRAAIQVPDSTENLIHAELHSRPRQAIRPGSEPYRPRLGQPAQDVAGLTKQILSNDLQSLSSITDEVTESQYANAGDVGPDLLLQDLSSSQLVGQTVSAGSSTADGEVHGEKKSITNEHKAIQAVLNHSLQCANPNYEQGGLQSVNGEASKTKKAMQGSSSCKIHLEMDVEKMPRTKKEVVSPGGEILHLDPILNRKAAQKLLERKSDTYSRTGGPGRGFGRNLEGSRGGRRGGRWEKDGDSSLLTWDEWEAKKVTDSTTIPKTSADHGNERTNEETDRDLAWMLQHELDLESQGGKTNVADAAEELRVSMFSFGRDSKSMDDGGGRGRSRGRGRGRGRGRWHI